MPSARRLASYTQKTRATFEEKGLRGLLVSRARLRLHIVEGPQEDALAYYRELAQSASGVGVRLIRVSTVKTPILIEALECLDLSEFPLAPDSATLEDVYNRAVMPDEASWLRTKEFLRVCLMRLESRRLIAA